MVQKTSYLTSFISDPMELDGPVADDQELSSSVVDTVSDFATAVNDLGPDYGLRLYDFEPQSVGNFADSSFGYTPTAGETVENVSGDMPSGTASGTLRPDEYPSLQILYFCTSHFVQHWD